MKSAHAFTRWEKWATEHPPTNYLSPLDHHDHTCSHRSSTNNHNYLPRILTLCLCKFSVEMHKKDGSWISNIAWCYVVAPGNTRLGDWLTFSFYRISGCPLDTATDSGWAGPQLVNPGRQNMKNISVLKIIIVRMTTMRATMVTMMHLLHVWSLESGAVTFGAVSWIWIIHQLRGLGTSTIHMSDHHIREQNLYLIDLYFKLCVAQADYPQNI